MVRDLPVVYKAAPIMIFFLASVTYFVPFVPATGRPEDTTAEEWSAPQTAARTTGALSMPVSLSPKVVLSLTSACLLHTASRKQAGRSDFLVNIGV